MNTAMRFTDKVALVTAGASGIGHATSLLLAEEGARVVVADIDEEAGAHAVAQIRDAGGEALFVHTDVGIESDIEHLFETVLARFGHIDVLFNGVGINMGKPITECTTDDFEAVMTLNLRSIFLMSKLAIQHFLANGTGGVIVNNASMGGLVGRPGDPLYVASKHAVNGMTKSLALAYADERIRVNSVCPGTIATPLLFENLAPGEHRDAYLKRLVASSPTPRAADAGEVAKAVLFLASDDASFVNGVALAVDGAKSAGMLKPHRYSMDFDVMV